MSEQPNKPTLSEIIDKIYEEHDLQIQHFSDIHKMLKDAHAKSVERDEDAQSLEWQAKTSKADKETRKAAEEYFSLVRGMDDYLEVETAEAERRVRYAHRRKKDTPEWLKESY